MGVILKQLHPSVQLYVLSKIPFCLQTGNGPSHVLLSKQIITATKKLP